MHEKQTEKKQNRIQVVLVIHQSAILCDSSIDEMYHESHDQIAKKPFHAHYLSKN